MSGTVSKDPPKDPPKSARKPRSTRRRKVGSNVIVAIITSVASIIATALTGWFGIAQSKLPVPSSDGAVTINVIQEETRDLQIQVDNLTETNDDLVAENNRLREEASNPTPTSTPSLTETEDAPSEPVYQDREFTIVGSEQSGRTAVVDFDVKGNFALQDGEWDDVQDADGPDPESADMAIEEYDYLVFARTIGHSSHDVAPAPDDPAACLADARAGEYDELYVSDELQVDDVICTQTTSGAVARLVVTDVNSEDYPYSVQLSVTLWA